MILVDEDPPPSSRETIVQYAPAETPLQVLISGEGGSHTSRKSRLRTSDAVEGSAWIVGTSSPEQPSHHHPGDELTTGGRGASNMRQAGEEDAVLRRLRAPSLPLDEGGGWHPARELQATCDEGTLYVTSSVFPGAEGCYRAIAGSGYIFDRVDGGYTIYPMPVNPSTDSEVRLATVLSIYILLWLFFGRCNECLNS